MLHRPLETTRLIGMWELVYGIDRPWGVSDQPRNGSAIVDEWPVVLNWP